MENELKRIADALERIANAKAEPTATVTRVEPEPVAKPKAKAKTKSPEGEGTGPKTGAQLMSYCNTRLVAIKDPEERASVIKQVIAMFKKDYGVTAIRELADEHVTAAKANFDSLVGEA